MFGFIHEWKKILVPGTIPKTWPGNFLFKIIAPVMRSIFVGKIQINGSENVPVGVPYLIVSNHVGWTDMFLLPMLPNKKDHIRILAHPLVMGALGPFSAYFFSLVMGCYTASLKATVELLKGQSVAICSEGWAWSAGDKTRPFKTGAVVAARATNVPIIPVHIRYGYSPGRWIYKIRGMKQFWVVAFLQIFFKRGAIINIGKPFYPKDCVAKETENLRKEVIRLGELNKS